MALRIIRKSASQSQVELIKGIGEGAPKYSLLCYLSTPSDLEQLKQLLQDDSIQQEAEYLIMKSPDLEIDLRTSISAGKYTIKLVSDPKDALWTLRLRSLIQEAQTDICLFLPLITDAKALAKTISAQVQVMQAQPQLGMIGVTFSQATQIWAAGQDFSHDPIKHQLIIDQTRHEFCPPDQAIFYLYRGLHLSDLPDQIRQVSGVPLPFSAIRRSAYQSLVWDKADWNLSWLAQDLAFGLRQKQYQLAIVPTSLNVDTRLQNLLEQESAPESFLEKWKTNFRFPIFALYQQHGWQEIAPHQFSPHPKPDLKQAIEQLKAEAAR